MVVREALECLESLKAEPVYPDPLFDAVVDKIPSSWKQSFFEKFDQCAVSDEEDILCENGVLTLKDLIKFLEKKARAMRRTEMAHQTVSSNRKRGPDDDKGAKEGDKKPGRNSRAFTNLPADQQQRKAEKGSSDNKSPSKQAYKAEKEAKKEESSRKNSKERWYCDICEQYGHTPAYCPLFKSKLPAQRWSLAKKHNLHFWCLLPHHAKDCPTPREKRQCKVDPKCEHPHHELLHFTKATLEAPEHVKKSYFLAMKEALGEAASSSGEGQQEVADEKDEDALCGPTNPFQESTNPFCGGHPPPKRIKGATLRLVKIWYRPKGSKKEPRRTVALQDQGSSLSYIDETEMRKFKAKLKLKPDHTTTMHGSRQAPTAQVELEISRDKQKWFPLTDVETFRNFNLPGPELNWSAFIEANPEFKGVEVDDVKFSEVKMLIGAQLEDEFLPLDKPGCRIKKNGIKAYKTQLGWTIGGEMDTLFGTFRRSGTFASLPRNSEEFYEEQQLTTALLDQFKRFNDMEAIGVESRKTKAPRAQQEEQAELDKGTIWENGRITTKMLWHGEYTRLPETEIAARKRLTWLQKKLLAKKNAWEQYAATIKADLDKGYIRKLTKQVKRSLIKATSTVAQLNYDALNTFMARAEAIINKRPLAIGKDLQIITPEMLLNAGAKVSFATSYNITRVLGQLRQLVDHFWSVWTDQYMLQLAPHRLRPGQPGYVELRPGEAVIFQKEATQQRLPGVSTMTAGKVVQPHPSSDGIVRRYTISDAEGKAFDVPVSRIFLSEQEAVARRGQATGAVPEG